LVLGILSTPVGAAETFAEMADRAIRLSDVKAIKGMKSDENRRRDDEYGSRRGFRDGRKTYIVWTVGETAFSADEAHRQFLADSEGFFAKREILKKDGGLGQKSVLYQTVFGDNVTGLTYLIWYDQLEIKVHVKRTAKPWVDGKAFRKFHASISARAARRLKPPCHPGRFADLASSRPNRHLDKPAKKLIERMCRMNIAFSWTVTDPYADIAGYVTDADGQYERLLRSGYEVALYKRIKNRAFNPKKFSAKLAQSQVFWEAVAAIVEVERRKKPKGRIVVRLWDAFLTAHNVVRLLARPEQWAGGWPMTEKGHDRLKRDTAVPMLRDLRGISSVDENPPFFWHFGPKAFRKHGDKLFDPAVIYRQMFRSGGPFGFYTAARGAEAANDTFGSEHWNGGIHYYFWVGVIVNFTGTSAATAPVGRWGNIGATMYERIQKTLGGEWKRGAVQTTHGHDKGGAWASELFSLLTHADQLATDYVLE